MRRAVVWIAFFSLSLFGVAAHAQSAFIEGHVFNLQSRRPIANTKVEIFVCHPLCAAPIGRLAGTDVTDPNGFYEVDLTDVPVGYSAHVRVSCPTSDGVIYGASDTTVRDETLRRDIYLRAPGQLIRCADSVLR